MGLKAMTELNHPSSPSRVVCDGARILFDIVNDGETIECAISRAALEDISETRCFKPAQMLASFTAARARIEAVALAKRQARPGPLEGRLNVWADDMDFLSSEADPDPEDQRKTA
jgi:hypothetical protein